MFCYILSANFCLSVANTSDHEKSIQFYESLLQKKGVTRVKTVLPLHQLQSEYSEFELKRKLADLYDVFLVDGKISNKVHHLLGKTFIKKHKTPTCVKLDCNDLKKNFDVALNKTSLRIHSRGDSFNVQVGDTGMSQANIFDNIKSVVEKLGKIFPGGWDNIRGLSVKTAKSTSIPIYYTVSKYLVQTNEI